MGIQSRDVVYSRAEGVENRLMVVKDENKAFGFFSLETAPIDVKPLVSSSGALSQPIHSRLTRESPIKLNLHQVPHPEHANAGGILNDTLEGVFWLKWILKDVKRVFERRGLNCEITGGRCHTKMSRSRHVLFSARHILKL